MEIKGDYTFEAPQQLVWEAVQDPQVLGSVMPGGEDFQETGENEYAGKLKVRVGPVQGLFTATIKLTNVVAPESYSIEVNGQGSQGHVKATGTMKLEAEGDNQTTMHYESDTQVGGRIATVGTRLVDSAARSIIRQSLEGLNEYLKVQVAAKVVEAASSATQADDAGKTDESDERVESAASDSVEPVPAAPETPVPTYKPPTQTQVALNVARDMFNDMVPPERRPIVAAGAIGVIVVILWLILR